jgi:uncharacterized protein (DUF952 family)
MALIYHITTRSNWEDAQLKGEYKAPSLESEGFIHCSEAGQVAGVLSRYYAGMNDLVKLIIDTEELSSPLTYELAPSVNENFPHVYGVINLEAVVAVEEIK